MIWTVFINDTHDTLAAISDNSLYVYNLKDYSVIYTDHIDDTRLKYADCVAWDDLCEHIMYSVCSIDASSREELRVADISEDSIEISALFAESEMKDCLYTAGDALKIAEKIVYSRSIGAVIDKYFGKDIYGNKYFGSDTMAIMISPANEIIASIEDMAGLSDKGDGILMQSFDEQRRPTLLKYDIFDKETLLKTAEFKMDYYNYPYLGSK